MSARPSLLVRCTHTDLSPGEVVGRYSGMDALQKLRRVSQMKAAATARPLPAEGCCITLGRSGPQNNRTPAKAATPQRPHLYPPRERSVSISEPGEGDLGLNSSKSIETPQNLRGSVCGLWRRPTGCPPPPVLPTSRDHRPHPAEGRGLAFAAAPDNTACDRFAALGGPKTMQGLPAGRGRGPVASRSSVGPSMFRGPNATNYRATPYGGERLSLSVIPEFLTEQV